MENCDIIFISYSESNAESNWESLSRRFPRAKRVHGVLGIDKAHIRAMELSESHFFFVVDGDNQVRPDFNFGTEDLHLRNDTLYVWRANNPVNGLVYGFGAIKLYNKTLLSKKVEPSFVDLATTIPTQYKIIHQVASDTHFHATAEEAWRGAFRESAKLYTQLLTAPSCKQTIERLDTWCQTAKPVPNGHWALRGAQEGRAFAAEHPSQLPLINNFNWLSEKFKAIAVALP